MRRASTASTSTRAAPRTLSRCDSRTFASRQAEPPHPPRRAEVALASSVWSRVTGRTRTALAAGLRALSPPLAESYYQELEELLVSADLGPAMAARIASGVRARAPRTREEAVEALVATALPMMSPKPRDLDLGARPACLLFYGMNGAGKTTTIGKLANRLEKD